MARATMAKNWLSSTATAPQETIDAVVADVQRTLTVLEGTEHDARWI